MKLKYISWFPAFLIMVIIFYFSSKPATSSGESSLMISRHLLSTYENITDQSYDVTKKQEVLSKLDYIVRKSAHFIEYMVLAASLFFHFTVWGNGLKGRVSLSILITCVYAATDEFHQTFVEGRSGQISDVLLDSCGAATGAFLCLLLVLIHKKCQNKRGKSQGVGSKTV